MAIYSFKSVKPIIHETAYVHPLACVIGEVIIGKDVYIGPFASLRGDMGRIVVEDGSNVQDHSMIHMFQGVTVWLKKNSHIGHGAILHGCVLEENCLVGMNAVIMDNVVIGAGSIVGAMSFVPADKTFAARSLIVGNPARAVKEVSDQMLAWKTHGTEQYQALARECLKTMAPCQPLREMPDNYGLTFDHPFPTWDEFKKKNP
jgi:carbonic anhydrase/acetyltransferase-like protein (isoleucine patch superfamily)